MPCLIDITFTEEASEQEKFSLFFMKAKIFRGAEVMSITDSSNGRKVVRIFVQAHENAVSRFLVETLGRERRIAATRIVS